MKIVLELFIILIFTLLGELIASILPFSFPGSVIGLLLLFVALMTKIVKVDQIKDVSKWLQKNMAFLFVPLCVGIMQYFDIIKVSWFEILLILVVSTIITLITTAVIAEKGVKHEWYNMEYNNNFRNIFIMYVYSKENETFSTKSIIN
ncbi:Putative effector of murein hydrolase LrgA [Haploplasma axanthum]|uniref:Effector of murein hydrolase LrgA n=1 Tax=Haploplasma axanthum TaxID=29552 RepID=A0A449BEH5_HAPAX|nr:Putative effector of murein hydrolase LrgA [Haploplasma axanthum]